MPNLKKVRLMCELVRRKQPAAQIVVGGHVAGLLDLHARIDADHICRGEGVRWMRSLLGDDEAAPIRHPAMPSALGTRIMGLQVPEGPDDVAATVLPSVGCPMGCDFCSTSALFGGKGKVEHLFKTGDELFEVMVDLERRLGTSSFFIMDENFLLYRRRALRLLELMEEHDKAWSLDVFSSADAVAGYSDDELVRLGVAWVWLGLEGAEAPYDKLSGIDTLALVRRLQEQGICVLGSTIIGFDHHTPDNIDSVIRRAVEHRTDFHQFMLLMKVPGTPANDGRMAPGEDHLADLHGQLRFNHRHPHIPPGAEGELLVRAFRKDFQINGPSVVRVGQTLLDSWLKHGDHPDPRVRRRVRRSCDNLPTAYAGLAWAARRRLRRAGPEHSRAVAECGALFDGLHAVFGLSARLAGPVVGTVLNATAALEERRLIAGRTLEPDPVRERLRDRAA